MLKKLLSALALVAAGPAAALPLLPGETLNTVDYFDFGEVADGDPDFFGVLMGSFTQSATETRDGLVGTDVIVGLYEVTGRIEAKVHKSTTGRIVFAYDFSSTDNSGTGINGARIFSVSGYSGYTIDVGWNFSSSPYAPFISRSADGDTVTVEYFDPRDTLDFVDLETILLATNAPTFSLAGTGTVGIDIDSFGTTVRTLESLPSPAEVPLPATGVLLLGAICMTRLSRRQS